MKELNSLGENDEDEKPDMNTANNLTEAIELKANKPLSGNKKDSR